MNNTFTIHQNERFHKLCAKLVASDICRFEKYENGTRKIICKDENTLSQIFQIVFLLYATPNESSIVIDSDKSAVVLKGQFINLCLINKIADKARTVLEILLSKEEDAAYEEAFNSLLCIYIAMITPLKVIYPNTYIVDLGEKSHEIDIIFQTTDNNYFLIETTRGFAKDKEKIDDTYSWHFKKAVFRKWLLEKFYPSVNCKLCYITLQTSEIVLQTSLENNIPSVLAEELKETQKINLTQKIIDKEEGSILLLSLAKLAQPLPLSDLGNLLDQELIQKLNNFILTSDKK